MLRMNGGQALIKSLYREGVRVVFGLPGAGQYEAVDALYEAAGIRYIATRHEQATTYMADGYARVSGQIATALVVPGPGLFNASAGMATAHAVSSPLLVVTGTRHHHDRDQATDPLTWLRPLTKWVTRVDQVSEIPVAVRDAFRHLKSGRPRPVAIAIPAHVFGAWAEIDLVEPAVAARSGGDPLLIDRAKEILVKAKKPVIWAGGGVVRAQAAEPLQALAEQLQAPVVTTRQGKGLISDRHPLCLGYAELRYTPLREWLATRDVILAVGTHLDFSNYRQQVIQIDIDEGQVSVGEHICPIVGDARPVLEGLVEAVSSEALTPVDPIAEIRAINQARFDPVQQLQPQWDFMQAIRAALPDDGILIQGMNQMGYYSRNYFPVYTPGTYLTASSHGTLGCAYPLALGAKTAQPDKAVVVLSGDGGFLYNAQELATAVQYRINAVVIVFNDNAYGNVLRAQIEEFDGHIIGTQLHNPDFVKLAETFGVRGVLAKDAGQLEARLREALAIEVPTLIEVPVGMMERQY